jgi:Skp family chaperone for outer membrane proteins
MKPLHAAFAALVLASFAAGSVFSQQRPIPTQIGFLDVHKVFESYRKCTDLAEQFKLREQGVGTELKAIGKQVEELTSRLNMLNSDTEEYAQIEEQIATLKDAYDTKKKFRLRGLELDLLKRRAAIYKEVSQEAQAYGQERGLAAVLLYIPPDIDFGRDLDIYVNTRAVLCRDDSLDVTKDVVSRLNAQLPPAPVKPPTPTPPQQPPK